MFLVGDTHGSYKTLRELIKKFPSKEDIVFVGDLIDRGPKSNQVLEFIIKEGHQSVMGNHEWMLLCYLFTEEFNDGFSLHTPYYWNFWVRNGGAETLKSYNENLTELFAGYVDIPEEHVLWIKNLPNFLEFKDLKTEDGRYLHVSHTHLPEDYAHDIQTLEYGHGRYHHFLRQYPVDYKEIFQVFGHTPSVPISVLLGDFYANIDTGCCFGHYLSALRFPSMEVYQRGNID